MDRVVAACRVASLLGTALDRRPAYVGLAEGLRLLIVDGRIPAGTRLPSERALTEALGVSRTTVTRGYDLLRRRGFLVSRRGAGSVARLPGPRGTHDHVLSPGDLPPDALDLTCAAPVTPPGVLAAYEAALAALPGYLGGTGYYPAGLPLLREAIAARYDARGLPTSPEQVIVTAGALGALAIATRACTGIGDRTLVESPTYPNAIATLRRAGTRVVGAPVDPTGWDLDATAALLAQVAPRLAYLVPDFHNPTGALLDDTGRATLAGALARSRTTVVVDETLVDLALDEVTLPAPMAAHLPDAVTVGSASKLFWGGLRIGWLRVPRDQVAALVAARLSLDLGAPLLEQLVLVELLAAHEQVRAHRVAALREARAALADALREQLPQWRFVLPPGGLSLWCELPDPLSSVLVGEAERHGLLLAPGPAFAPEGGLERFLRVPYTRTPEELADAVPRLADSWAQAQQHRRSAPSRSPLVA